MFKQLDGRFAPLPKGQRTKPEILQAAIQYLRYISNEIRFNRDVDQATAT